MGYQARRLITVPLLLLLLAAAPASRPGVAYEKQSEFNYILVRDTAQGMRELLFEKDGALQSVMKLDAPDELVLPYTRLTMTGLAVVPKPQRICIIGLGGASMPKFLRKAYPEAHIDCVELDPAVAEATKQFFAFKEDARMKVHVGDGRKFIETTQTRYDLIFLDAYGADSIPYSLATREFLLAVREKLSDTGIAVANIWDQRTNKLYYPMLRTYQDAFDELHIIRAGTSGNRIFLAVPRKTKLTEAQLAADAAQLRAPGVPELDLPALIRAGYDTPILVPAGTKVLRDGEE